MNLDASGIYAIRNNTNGKAYIGSSIDMYRRRNQHFNALKNNHHYNNYLQNSWNKYSEENFIFEVLEYVLEENQLAEREKAWINKFSNSSYNLIKIVEGNFRPAEETRKRMALAAKQKFARDGNPLLGRTLPEETKMKISQTLKGRVHSEETKIKLSQQRKGKHIGRNNPFYGHKHTEETKRKISQKLKGKYTGQNNPFYGRKHTEEIKRKISQNNMGYKHTEESKQKISEAARNRKNRVIYQNDLQLLLF